MSTREYRPDLTPTRDLEEPTRREPKWPDGKPFAVCLTHDVDHVTKYSVRQTLRELFLVTSTRNDRPINQVTKTGVKKVGKVCRDAARSLSSQADPLHCYERWLEIEESVGARSTFFFMPNETNRPHFTDNEYRFDDSVLFDDEKCDLKDVIAEIHNRGWEIGLHPTWNAATDKNELRYQKNQLETVIDTDVVSVRQHYLNYDFHETPAAHSGVGLKYDSTLGFNETVGFRFGTAHPWHLYDPINKRQLDLLEIPLIVQDVGLFRDEQGLGCSPDEALDLVTVLSDNISAVGGVMTLSWHPSYIVREEWRTVYERILTHLDEQDAWFATMRELGNWWNTHHGYRNN